MMIDNRLREENAMINGVGSGLLSGAEAGQEDYRNGNPHLKNHS